MKDYFNTIERDQFLTFLKSLDHGETIEQAWGERGNLTKEELKALRMVKTWGKKFIESVLKRQNDTSLKATGRAIRSSELILDYKGQLDELLKKRCSDINKSYEENRDYFSLIELLMHYNCKNCSRKCTECLIYPEFEKHNVPEFSGWENLKNCKYSYESKEEENNNE